MTTSPGGTVGPDGEPLEPAERSLADRFLEQVDEIPTLPRVVLRVVELCNDPMTTMAQFDAAFSTDPALAGKVLRLVNSSYFSLPRPVSSISRAVTFLGFTAIRAVALSFGVRETFRQTLDGPEWESWWTHSFATSETARQVAQTARIGSPDDAQAAGLFHDIVCLLLPIYFPADAERRGLGPEHHDNPERERATLGTDHGQLAAALLEKWGLPRPVTAGVRFHHGDNDELRANPAALAVNVAEHLLRRWGEMPSPSLRRVDPLPAAEGVLEAFESEFETLEIRVRERVADAQRILE